MVLMTTKNVRERELMKPGAMVETTDEIYTIPDEEGESYDEPILPPGTIGIILERPKTDRPRQYLISFVGGRHYWVYTNEIQPYMGEKNV